MKQQLDIREMPLKPAREETAGDHQLAPLHEELPASKSFLILLIAFFLLCMTATALVYASVSRREQQEKGVALCAAIEFYTMQSGAQLDLTELTSLAQVDVSHPSAEETPQRGSVYAAYCGSNGDMVPSNPVAFCSADGQVILFAYYNESGNYICKMDGSWSIGRSVPKRMEDLLNGSAAENSLTRVTFTDSGLEQ